MAKNETPTVEAPVVTKAVKSWYNFPEYGISVEATSPEEAVKLTEKQRG